MAEITKKASFYNDGKTTNVTAADAAIEYHDIVSLADKRIGIAVMDIPEGESGTVHLEGAWVLPKKASANIKQGEAVYFVKADKVIDKTEASNVPAGFALEDSPTTATTVLVKIG